MFSKCRPRTRSMLAALALGAGALILIPASTASAAALCTFTCTDRSGAVAGVAATVYNVKVAHHDGYDRLVIGFPTANSLPSYQLTRQATSTFIRDARGVQSRYARTSVAAGATGELPDGGADCGLAGADRGIGRDRHQAIRAEMTRSRPSGRRYHWHADGSDARGRDRALAGRRSRRL